MEKPTYIKKFLVNEKSFYGKMIWKPNKDDLFHIKLFDGDTTWSGQFSYELAKKFKDIHIDETEEQYYDNVMKGLSKVHNFSYSFDLKDDNETAEFRWKKQFENSPDKIEYLLHGSVPVHRDKVTESKDILIDLLLAQIEDLKQTVETISCKNNDLTVDLDKYRNDLNKFVDIKTTLETSLYGKFVQLLSSKKRRIQLLEENISKIVKPNKNMDELD